MEPRHGWELRHTQPRPLETWSSQSCLSRAGRLGSLWILLFAQLFYFLSEVKKFPEQGRQVRILLNSALCSIFLLFVWSQKVSVRILLLFAPGKFVASDLFFCSFLLSVWSQRAAWTRQAGWDLSAQLLTFLFFFWIIQADWDPFAFCSRHVWSLWNICRHFPQLLLFAWSHRASSRLGSFCSMLILLTFCLKYKSSRCNPLV